MLKLSDIQFERFYEGTKNLIFDELVELSPIGLGVVVLSTPYPDLSLVFNRQEWEQFFGALDEANYMLSVYQLIYQ